MREKELRLALVCYGGISLAVYMHGITKEIWHVVRASRAFHAGEAQGDGVAAVYYDLLKDIQNSLEVKLRVFADIIAGASAGGINGIFLAQAIATGQSLEPLADLWLEQADVEHLLDPDARPLWRFGKLWAIPIAWFAMRRRGSTIDKTVAAGARDEVRLKLSRFVRARWFEPPFGGSVFTTMLYDAFSAMAQSPAGPSLLPDDQPLDLFVTVTDFRGHAERLMLNSPRQIEENEHRLTLAFRQAVGSDVGLGSIAGLTYAARATASFPGAFPPFKVSELDAVIAAKGAHWPDRSPFLASIFPRDVGLPEHLVLIDGSVLANAPFRPAIEALRDRPARREIDRRFVYIDPKPGLRSVRLTRKGDTALPGFFATILGAMSDIPREQPIRDNLDAIEARSTRIRRMQRIIDAVRPEVEASIQSLFGKTFFLDRPTTARIKAWRSKAQDRAATEAGHAFSAYGHVKLSGIVEELIHHAERADPMLHGAAMDEFRSKIWTEVRRCGADQMAGGNRRGASESAITFFKDFDLRFRIRRLRFVARTVTALIENGHGSSPELLPVEQAMFEALAPYLEMENAGFLADIPKVEAAVFFGDVRSRYALLSVDSKTDEAFAIALEHCNKAHRRVILFAYLGFPYFDIATLPMLQGEGLDEFDPVKVDRIAPDDARSIREGGATATLKGIQLNSFGAFFSRAYRENDYLWGRLHGAERMIDIIFSTLPQTQFEVPDWILVTKRRAFEAILDEETGRLQYGADEIATIRSEIANGPLAKYGSSA